MEKGKLKKIIGFVVIFALIAVGFSALAFPSHPGGIGTIRMPASILNTNPVNTELNVTVSRVAYITQPTEWLFSKISPQPMNVVNPTSTWTLNNSGYFMMVSNSTGSTAPNPEIANFNLASSVGSTVSYAFFDSRVALNGTGETGYIVVSEAAQTAVPAGAANNVLATSAGAAVNQIDVIFSESSGTWTVTVGYYAWVMGANAKAYENYTSTSISGVALQPLWLYDVYINIQTSGTVVSVINATGTVLGSTSSLAAVADGNLTKLTYLSYETAPAASTSGDMFILDYAYYVNHNVYTNTAAIAGAMVNLPSAVAPFDPGTSTANYTTAPNSTTSTMNTNVSTSDFSGGIVPSGSNAGMTSSLLNTHYLPAANQTTIYAANATTAIRATNETSTSISASLYITTWTPAGIQAALISYLQNYIGQAIGVMPSQVTIISYLITDVGINMYWDNSTANTIRDFIYNSVPGIMQSDGYALVNTTTNAIVAGAGIGGFWYYGSIVYPAIINGMIYSPYGPVYSSPQAAGFPVGSEIMNGQIFVPGQYAFYGFAADGAPIFASGWNPFGGLTGAASAVANFFSGAAKTVQNALQPVSSTITNYAVKPISTIAKPLPTLWGDVTKTAGSIVPFIGGVAANLGHDISGTLSSGLNTVSSGLGSFKNTVVGALATGVNDVKNTIFHIGSTIAQLPAGLVGSAQRAGSYIWNTVGHAVSTIGGVISPIVTGVRNLPYGIWNGIKNGATSIANAAGTALNTVLNAGKGIVDTVGHDVSSAATGLAAWLGNTYNQMSSSFINGVTGGLLQNAQNSVFSFFTGLSSTVGHYIIPIVIGGGLIIIIIAVAFMHSKNKHHRTSRSHRTSHHRR